MKAKTNARGSLRMRLTLLTAGVFFVVGAALLTLTYFLVLNTVPPETPVQALRQQEVLVCEAQQRAAAATAHPPQVPSQILQDQNYCRNVFRQGAGIGSTANRSSTLHDLLWYSGLGLTVMTGVAAATAWILAGRALRPLRDVAQAAATASRATLRQRLPVPSQSGELKQLTDTFNDMLDRLDAAFVAQERFVADASHELRTPLTTLGAVVDVTMAKANPTPQQLDRMADDIRRQLQEADALISSLLVLSRSDTGLVGSEPVDLAEMVDDTLRARATALTVERDLVPAPLQADRTLLECAVANLVDNAVIHNDERVWLRATTFTNGTQVGLTIENTGPRKHHGKANELFRPFYRDEARTGNGHGLGMAIVRSVVKAHGGSCEAKWRPDGGLAVTVTMAKPSTDGLSPEEHH